MPAFDHIAAYYVFMCEQAQSRKRWLWVARYAERLWQYQYNNGNPRSE